MVEKNSPEQTSPSRAGQYYVMEKIAQGGMAEIFKGLSYDAHGLKKTVCIKKILPHIAASPEFIESLITEAKTAVTLSHGNIAHTYDLGKVGNDYFIVMEFVDGKSLSQIARRAASLGERMPLAIACFIVAEIANGLDYMHRRQDERGNPLHIVHRDISPQNVVVSFSGTVKIIDFGIATTVHRVAITDTGVLKGKFSYMSPEQAQGDSIDHRSDIFSLGVILHELVTGRRLFKGEDNRATLRNVRRASVPPPSSLVPELPDDIDRICLKALTKDRRQRFESAAEFRDALNKFLHTVFPHFQMSDIAAYLQKLFHQDLKQRKPEEELQTPHLIMENTDSALSDGSKNESTFIAPAPVDIREFLLEDIPEKKKNIAALQVIEEERTSRKQPRKALMLGAGALLGIIIVGIFSFFIARTKHEPTPALPPQAESPKTAATSTSAVEAKPFPIRVHVTSSPSGAAIYLDEQQTSFTTPKSLENISPGKHTLGIFLDGYRFWKREIDVSAGENLNFDVALAKDFGSLLVTSEPSEALVIINDIPAGQTPLLREELEPGRVLRVEIWSEGFERAVHEVRIRPGRREEIRTVLTKELDRK